MKKSAILLTCLFFLCHCTNVNHKILSPLTEQQKVFYHSFETNKYLNFQQNDNAFTLQQVRAYLSENMYREEKAGFLTTPGYHYISEEAFARYQPTTSTDFNASIKELYVSATGGTTGGQPRQSIRLYNKGGKEFEFKIDFNNTISSITIGGQTYTDVVVSSTANNDLLYWKAPEGLLGWKEANGAINYRTY